jgi:hypothetical protein
LAKVGGPAEEMLRQALEGNPSAELKLLLGKLRTAPAQP